MFDCHAHYDDEAYDSDRNELLRTLFSSGVSGIVNSGVSEDTTQKAISLAESFEGMFFSAGVHPEYAETAGDYESWLIPALSHPKCVALGEIGLDYHYDSVSGEAQLKLFRNQLSLAGKLSKPVVIHDRDAHGDCLECVLAADGVRGMFHSFSGSAEMAEMLVRHGWYISFSGVVTFKNAIKSVQAAEAVPLDRILTETDCPYLTPHPFRGSRNDSGRINLILEKLAELKGVAYEDMERITTENAHRFFGIST